MDQIFLQTFLIALLVGAASGCIGAFIILKRMALVGDALSHVALPGIAIALAYHIDPFWGVLVFLLTAAVIIWWLEGRTKLPADALVGLLFTTSLAIGILTIPNSEILESLFGGFSVLTFWPAFLVIIAALLTLAATFIFSRQFLFQILSPDLAKVSGIGRGYNLILLAVFACVVALGIKLVGTLLMGALTIIPASIAKNYSRSMAGFLLLSSILGGVISGIGVWVANSFQFLPGPTIILLGVLVFLASLFVEKRDKKQEIIR